MFASITSSMYKSIWVESITHAHWQHGHVDQVCTCISRDLEMSTAHKQPRRGLAGTRLFTGKSVKILVQSKRKSSVQEWGNLDFRSRFIIVIESDSLGRYNKCSYIHHYNVWCLELKRREM